MISVVEAQQFAGLFNEKVVGAYRQVTTYDILLMARVGLIGQYDRLFSWEIETVRRILRYEQLRDKQPEPPTLSGNAPEPQVCRLCKQHLATRKEGKRGRPQLYCDACVIERARQRNREWRARKSKTRRKTEMKISLR